ncbi:MAG: hypothetical protein KDA76_11050 [Planctomycetaceae bacterium]|nr:hypothetical protein [Planctomycetaceae bacterium]
MPRIRAVLFGILLFLGIVLGAEYAIRQNDPRVSAWMRDVAPYYGWTPSATVYFDAPINQSCLGLSPRGEVIPLHYDSHGFRVKSPHPRETAGEWLCLGSARVLAPDCEASQTFCELWGTKRAGPALASNVINAGMPFGCPLLYSLHLQRLEPVARKHWLCFLGTETPLHDRAIRRGLEVNRQGETVSSVHPHALFEGKPPAPNQHPLMESRLVKWILPRLCDALLGRTDDSPHGNSPCSELPGSQNSAEISSLEGQLSLEPLHLLRNFVETRGGTFTLVYLPSACEFTPSSADRAGSATNFRLLVHEYAKQHQLPLIDLTEALSRTHQTTNLFGSSANILTPSGHEIVAEQLEHLFFSRMADQASPRSPAVNLRETQETLTR